MADHVRDAKRANSSKLVVGEVRGEGTMALLDAMSSGLDGCIVTLPSPPGDGVMEKLTAYATSEGADESLARRSIAIAVHLLVWMGRNHAGERVIADVTQLTAPTPTARSRLAAYGGLSPAALGHARNPTRGPHRRHLPIRCCRRSLSRRGEHGAPGSATGGQRLERRRPERGAAVNASGWVIGAGGAIVLTIVLWPAGGTRWSLRARSGRRRRTPLPAELPAAAAAGSAMIVLGLAAGHAAAAAMCAVVCTSAVKVLVMSRRRVVIAEGVARFASVLTNQAAVAVTAADAVAKAAPLVSGPVGEAAVSMAADCESVGVDIAAERFAARVPSAVANSLADLIAVSAEGGGRWTETVSLLEAEASQTAKTARLFHARVAVAMPTLGLVVLLGAGLVAGAGQVATDVGRSCRLPGAALLMAGAVVVTAVSARVLLPARSAVRYGGLQ